MGDSSVMKRGTLEVADTLEVGDEARYLRGR